jgi:hypothetical protein
MGLDCSHDAFHGAYSAFNSFRQEVCRAAGGSYPPHWLRTYEGKLALNEHGNLIRDNSLDGGNFYLPDDINQASSPGLWEFLTHSDCDGEISAEMCALVADELEPLLEKMPTDSGGHIAARGGYREVLQYFIDGCRAAHAANEPLEFH